MRKPNSGGGWQAIFYTFRKAREVGPLRFWRAMRSKNACKTCALGMGGQLGGMRNEAGHFPEVCKKSMQAMAADMSGRIEARFFAAYSLEQLKGFSSREMEMQGRLTSPLIAGPGDTHYREISWDEAINHVAGALRATPPERAFFYASGRSSNEAGFLLQLFARAYGTNHVNNCSYYCHQASGVGLKDSIGNGTATVALEDVAKCDLFLLIGGNPASNHPRLMTSLMDLRKRGGRIVVVNPLKEAGLVNFKVPSNVRSMLFGTEVASTLVQPTIGGDIALFAGIAKRLVELSAVEEDYIAESTEGFEELEKYVSGLSWDEIERASGVARGQIWSAAEEYARSERTIFAWTMGITHHEHGVQNVQWIANLALLRGMVGRPGAGLLPIRGHSNVQGIGSVGVKPELTKAAVEGLAALGIAEPSFRGHDTMAAIEASYRGEMSFGICLGGNLFGANPDASYASAALAKLDTMVYLSTSLNTGHAHGLGRTTLILPVLARDEEPQSTTQESMFNYVRLSDGGRARHEGPRSETSILADIASRVLGSTGPLEWEKLGDHNEIRAIIPRLVPELAELHRIGETKKEFEIPGRVLHRATFATASGRAIFHAHPLPELALNEPNQLRLMTVRSEGQFNTVVYEEEDIYRGQERRDVILMNASDMSRMGFVEDQAVDIRSDSGVMTVLARSFDIAAGCAAMYYPEANVLVSRAVDPRSKTPGFKSVVVSVAASRKGIVGREALIGASKSERRGMKAC